MVTRKHHDLGFMAIAILKLVKGVVLFLIGVGAVSLMRTDTSSVLINWAHALQMDTHSKFIQRWLLKLGLMRHRDLAVVAFFYSGLMFTEGIGLLLEKTWAKYMTAIITSTFIPLELYEMIRRVTYLRVCVLVLNVIVVTYLVMRICQRKRADA